jgi:hypothetical protein
VVKIRKLKNGTYKAIGDYLFSVISIKPNLRKNIKDFMELESDSGFRRRLYLNHPLAKVKKVKLKVEKFGGCWKVYCAKTDRLIMIHDLEFDKTRLKR